MKNLFFAFMAFAAIALSGCGKNETCYICKTYDLSNGKTVDSEYLCGYDQKSDYESVWNVPSLDWITRCEVQ